MSGYHAITHFNSEKDGCIDCYGKGIIEGSGGKMCPRCHGTGKACNICKGAGAIKETKKCPTCEHKKVAEKLCPMTKDEKKEGEGRSFLNSRIFGRG